MIKHIAIIGSGNAAGVLAKLFFEHQIIIDSIHSSNSMTGTFLAECVKAEFRTDYVFNATTQLVLICTQDDRIEDVVKRIGDTTILVCHCAGSICMTVLNSFRNYGVIYPLQSLSNNIDIKTLKIPFLIETNTTENEMAIAELISCTKNISTTIQSEMRLQYHLAAVFANNFSNAMFMAAQQIIESKHLNFELLKPLIQQTVHKLENKLPSETQTGPAMRYDEQTISKHLELLGDNESLKDIYSLISRFISNYKK